MGDTRRVGYLLGSLSVWPSLKEDLTVLKPHDVTWLLRTLADSCDFVYFICDNVGLLADFGILPLKRATNDFIYDGIGTRVWVVSSVAWTLLDLLELRSKESDKQQRSELYKSLVSNLCNLLIGCYFLWPDRPITSPMAGVLGMSAAVIGLHSKWVNL